MRREGANPPTSQLAMKLRSGLQEVRNAVRGEVDVDPSSWRAILELEGLTREDLEQGWSEAITKLRDWLVLKPSDLSGPK